MTKFGGDREASRKHRRFWMALIAAFAVIAATLLIVAAKLTIWSACPTSDVPRCLGDFMRAMKWLGFISSIFLMIVSSLTFLPDEFVAVANGLAFGPWLGSAASWIGSMAAANIVYWFGRTIGPDAVMHAIGDRRMRQLSRWVEKKGALALLGVRLLPLVPSLAVGFAAGALRISWLLYNVVTAIAIVPTLIVFSFAGGQLSRIPPSVWMSLLIGVTIVFVIAARRERRFK